MFNIIVTNTRSNKIKLCSPCGHVAKIINLVTGHRNAYYASKKLPNISTQREVIKRSSALSSKYN